MNTNSLRLPSAAFLCGTTLLLWLPGAAAMLTDGRPGAFHEIVRSLPAARSQSSAEAAEAARWQEILTARRPSRIVALGEAYLREFPTGSMRDEARKLVTGAARALSLQYEVGLSGDFFESTKGDATLATNLMGAARGSPSAAFELAQAFGKGSHGVSPSLYRQEQWLRVAAELGHARASWELAELYNVYGRVGDAAHYERRALALGYKPPPRLPTRDY